VSTHTSWRSEVEPNKEDEDEVEPLDFGKMKSWNGRYRKESPSMYAKEHQTVRTKGVFLHYVVIALNHQTCVGAVGDRGNKLPSAGLDFENV
jgi:hypothetical protein